MSKQINDLNFKEWKQYEDLLTDSLWCIEERSKIGAHNNRYHGNFIPQIPYQLIQRFTKKGDLILDPFLGCGTSLIEAKRLGRIGIGIEIIKETAKMAKENLKKQEGEFPPHVITADSTSKTTVTAVKKKLDLLSHKEIQLIVLHPPYHDVIQFSSNPKDLSNIKNLTLFVQHFGKVLENFFPLLEKKHYMAIVIGDKYAKGEWIPISFHLMQEALRCCPELRLKSIIVKNMSNNRAKRNQYNLWRYRALVGGYYIFKHEYIFLFEKK